VLNAIVGRSGGPWPAKGHPDLSTALIDEDFDRDNHSHLQALYNSLAKLLRENPGFPGRVIGGMCAVICYQPNELIDLEAQHLDLHPRLRSAVLDSELLEWLLRNLPGDALRDTVGVVSDTASMDQWRERISQRMRSSPKQVEE
jgi:hypothetical protein